MSCLAEIPQRPLGTVVHVGAGHGGVLADYARLQPGRVVLIEGDRDAAARLREEKRAHPFAEAIECAVAPSAGEAVWHTFNLPRFNGLHVPAGLQARYPRLRELPGRTVATAAFSALSVLQEPRGGVAPDVLVLDVPGQEVGLLASLDPDALQRFQWIVVRTCALDEQGGADTSSRIAQVLEARCFRPVRAVADTDLLWPTRVFRLDASRLRIEQYRARIAALEEHLTQARGAEAALREERESLAEAAVREKARLRAERDELAEKAQAMSRQIQDLVTQHERQTQRLGELEVQVSALSRQLATLTTDRDRWQQVADERASHAQSLQQRLRAQEQHATLLKAEQERDAALRQALMQQELSKAEEQLELVKELLLGESQP